MSQIDIPNYEPDFAAAVKAFWGARDEQAERQLSQGKVDAGTRGAVTGGKHLDKVADLVAQILVDAGLELPRPKRLPGYYRRSKNWDVVSMYGRAIGAVVELKSQVGSIGNNANNRIEEMIGQSVDLWKAVREDLMGPIPPWFGYFMLVEESSISTRKTSSQGMHPYPEDGIFNNTSYLDRYAIALKRLRHERDMDQVCLVASSRDGSYHYPDSTMSFQAFAASLHARGLEVRASMRS